LLQKVAVKYRSENLHMAGLALREKVSRSCLEIYGRVARCRSEDDLDDLEQETARRFGPLPAGARDFFAVARLRLDCKRRGIMRLDAGPEAVAATFLPGRLRKVKSKLLRRDGDRVVYASKQDENPFERIEEFIGILDE
jgi:transcription-repair coupling factor (superfamily II helicase)